VAADRLQLNTLVYNLGNFLLTRTALPEILIHASPACAVALSRDLDAPNAPPMLRGA